MNEQDKHAFAELMILTSEMYERRDKPSKAMMQMYFTALQRFSIDDVRTGLNAHIQNPDSGQFYPKPADIIRGIGGNSDTRALSAWSKVDKAIRCVGPYKTVVFDDPVIHAVLTDMGGWVTMCGATEQEYPFRRNEFEKRYRGFMLNPPKEHPRALIGIAQTHNEANDHDIETPTMIGNEERAALTYSTGSAGNGIAITSGVKRIGNMGKLESVK